MAFIFRTHFLIIRLICLCVKQIIGQKPFFHVTHSVREYLGSLWANFVDMGKPGMYICGIGTGTGICLCVLNFCGGVEEKMDSLFGSIPLARLFMLVAFVSGVLGLIVGLIDKTWKYGSVGYFTGGLLLAVLALTILANEYFARKNS